MAENKKLDRNLITIFLITLIAVLGVASIAPAFPKIAAKFNITPREIGLLVTLFVLPGVFINPVLGALADRYGRKRILVPALLLFGVAGSLCGIAPTFNILLILVFLQGIGAAPLGALNVTLIGDIYSGSRRTEAMGYNAGVLSLGTGFYPVIGGALAVLGWNYPFFLAALAIPVAFLVKPGIKYSEERRNITLKEYFESVRIILKDKKAITYFVISFLTFVLLFGSLISFLPFLIKNKFSNPEMIYGPLLGTMSIFTAAMASVLGKLAKKFGRGLLLKIAFMLYALALIIIANASSIPVFFLGSAIYGIAHGINMPGIQSLLADMAQNENRGLVMSINRTVALLGQASGPVLAGFIFAGFGGIIPVFYSTAGLGALVSITLIFVLRDEAVI